MNDRGFTLVEALVALLVLGITAISVLPAFITHLDTNTRNERRSEAVTAAQERLEELRLADLDTILPTDPPDTQVFSIEGRDYDVKTSYCLRAEYCPPVNPGSRHFTIEVLFDGRKVYDVETVYTQL